MFQYLISIRPLGLMYGSAGTFLSPENLVGRSGQKFPPDAATLSGLFFSEALHATNREIIKEELYISGPFWSKNDDIDDIYVPIPWTKVFGENENDSWYLTKNASGKRQWQRDHPEVETSYRWLPISYWETKDPNIISKNKNKTAQPDPWRFMPMLHPKMEMRERCSVESDGLFLENAVRLDEEVSLVYLSTHDLKSGWYRFGGESHLVEVTSHPIEPDSELAELLNKPITDKFALITPAVWSSNRFSYRVPQHNEFPAVELMLTDKPVFHRFRMGGRLGRGRYAVPVGSVYVLEEPINKAWWDWPNEWFSSNQKQDLSPKHIGCGLCLPLNITEHQLQQGAA